MWKNIRNDEAPTVRATSHIVFGQGSDTAEIMMGASDSTAKTISLPALPDASNRHRGSALKRAGLSLSIARTCSA